MMEHMLTTVDNPHDPFDNYDEWFEFDDRMGYHTPGYLARIVVSSEELSDQLQLEAIENAIDEIIEVSGDGFYKKVSREVQSTSG